MRHFRTIIIISLAILLAATVGMSLSFAGTGSLEQPPGESPYGEARRGETSGITLSGGIVIEYGTCIQGCVGTDWEGESDCYNSRVFLILTHGNDTKRFYEEGTLPGDEYLQIPAIIDLMDEAILDEFFDGDYSRTVSVISLGEPREPECADLLLPEVICTEDCNPSNLVRVEYVMVDVEIAVKK